MLFLGYADLLYRRTARNNDPKTLSRRYTKFINGEQKTQLPSSIHSCMLATRSPSEADRSLPTQSYPPRICIHQRSRCRWLHACRGWTHTHSTALHSSSQYNPRHTGSGECCRQKCRCQSSGTRGQRVPLGNRRKKH